MSAMISDCGLFRYRLEREGRGEGATAVIMVNPSTADAVEDDHTIRKLLGFGERNGWGRIIVGNLFAYRAKDVQQLKRAADPVGPENDLHLDIIFQDVDQVVFAWGPISKQPVYHRGRWREIARMATARGQQPLSIGPVAKCGHPKHPLTLGYELPILPWSAP